MLAGSRGVPRGTLRKNNLELRENNFASRKNKINKFRNDNNIPSGFISLDQKKLQAQINDGKVIIKFVSDDFYLYCLLISKNKVIPIKYEKEINYYKSLFEKIDLQKQDFDFRLFKDQSYKIYTEVFSLPGGP